MIPLLMTSDILQHDEMIRVARWSNTSTCVCVCVCVCVSTACHCSETITKDDNQTTLLVCQPM